MKILIIGSEGFIGRHCVTFFTQKGYDVYGCDLVDYTSSQYTYSKISRLQPDFDNIISASKYDVCINAAGNGSVPFSIEHPVSDFEANCSDVIRILELIRQKNQDCKYIHLSSAAVYGNPQSLPIAENDYVRPLSPYGWHKYIAEELCKEYYTLYQLQIVIVRPFSIYGPGLRKQLFWDLYQKCNKNPASIALWGTGSESRDFIYIADIMQAFNLIIDYSPMQADIYNLGNGTEVTIQQAAQQFITNYNANIQLMFNNQQRAGDPLNWKADISNLQSLGYKPEYSFTDGINETVQWLRNIQ